MPWRNQELQHQLVRDYVGINKVFGSDNELLFTGTAGSETMLGICKNIIIVIVLHDMAEYYMFNQLATCKLG